MDKTSGQCGAVKLVLHSNSSSQLIINNHMELQAIPVTQFFSPLLQQTHLNIARQSPHLESFFSSNHIFQNTHKISLTDNFLLISKKQENGFKITHFLHLSTDLKFQRLKPQNCINGQQKHFSGFKLYRNSNQLAVNIYIQFASLAEIWIKWFTKNLVEVGFDLFYKKINKIGQGSTSEVWEVQNLRTGVRYAAKVISRQYIQAKAQRIASLQNETAILRQIDHPNLLHLQAVLQSSTSIYIICEKLNGGTLTQQIKLTKGFTTLEVKLIMRGILSGLEQLHKFGIAHRDIKMENIMFRDQDRQEPVIVDFGLATFTDNQPYVLYRCGTPGYVAPEIIRMKQHKKITVECDIFSAGVVFHVLLTNKFLFEGTTNDQIYHSNLKGDFDLYSKFYKQKDRDAVQLMGKMLIMRPSVRITAAEALDESFLLVVEDSKEQLVGVSPAATEVGDAYQL